MQICREYFLDNYAVVQLLSVLWVTVLLCSPKTSAVVICSTKCGLRYKLEKTDCILVLQSTTNYCNTLGITYKTLRALIERIVFCSLNIFFFIHSYMHFSNMKEMIKKFPKDQHEFTSHILSYPCLSERTLALLLRKAKHMWEEQLSQHIQLIKKDAIFFRAIFLSGL